MRRSACQYSNGDTAGEKRKGKHFGTALLQLWQPDAESETSTYNKSITEKSDTAMMVCEARDVAAKCGFGPDYLAHMFSSGGYFMNATSIAEDFHKSGMLPFATLRGRSEAQQEQQKAPYRFLDIITFMQVRTCWLDDVVEQFGEDNANGCNNNGSNIIILGAGYDTRAHRLSLPPTAKLFEVDAPGSQHATLSMIHEAKLAQGGLPRQDEVRYVACDFQKESWLERLKESGMSTQVPTMIVWEGVTMYLPAEVVEQTMRTIASAFDAPCAVAFDYVSDIYLEEMKPVMKIMGEPWLFGLQPEDMSSLVRKQGLQVVDHISGAQGLARYMPVRADDSTSVGICGDQKTFMLAANNKFQQCWCACAAQQGL